METPSLNYSTFLGCPLNKYDIDEIKKQQSYTAGELGRLTALSSSIPLNQKSISSKNQYYRDEHGKKRFHGAFTGGFSAGYFNSVGSREGWTPMEFKSTKYSRASCTNSFKSNIENYMDEEDFQDMTLNSNNKEFVKCVENFSLELDGINNKNTSVIDSGTFFILNDQNIGQKILRSMGWREGRHYLLTKHVINSLKNETKKIKGPCLNFSQNILDNEKNKMSLSKSIVGRSIDSLNNTSLHSVNEGSAKYNDSTLINYFNIITRISSIPRNNRNRVGLDGFLSNKNTISENTISCTNKNKGMGIGILEDDDCDEIYDTGENVNINSGFPMDSDYFDVMPINTSSFIKSKSKNSWCIDDFLLNSRVDNKYKIEKLFNNSFPYVYTPSSKETYNEMGVLRLWGENLLNDAFKYVHLEDDEIKPCEKLNIEMTNDYNRKAPHDNLKSISHVGKAPLWNRASFENKNMFIDSVSLKSKFIQGIEDLTKKKDFIMYENKDKQKRFEYFVLAKEMKISLDVLSESRENIFQKDLENEIVEFESLYKTIKERDDYSDISFFFFSRYNNLCKKENDFKRAVRSWDPNPALLRILNLSMDSADRRERMNNINLKCEYPSISKKKPKSEEFIDNILRVLGCEKKETSLEVKNENTVINEEEGIDFQRPAMTVFKQVFGDFDDN